MVIGVDQDLEEEEAEGEGVTAKRPNLVASFSPEEAAGGIFLLCTPWSNFIHGQVINVTGGQFTGMYF